MQIIINDTFSLACRPSETSLGPRTALYTFPSFEISQSSKPLSFGESVLVPSIWRSSLPATLRLSKKMPKRYLVMSDDTDPERNEGLPAL